MLVPVLGSSIFPKVDKIIFGNLFILNNIQLGSSGSSKSAHLFLHVRAHERVHTINRYAVTSVHDFINILEPLEPLVQAIDSKDRFRYQYAKYTGTILEP